MRERFLKFRRQPSTGSRERSAERSAIAQPAKNLPLPLLEAASHCVGADDQGNQTFYKSYGKRLIDLMLVTAVSPVWIGLSLLLCVLISLDGGNPLYCQFRIGKGGQVFRMWKLRSMKTDAGERLKTLLLSDPAARDEWNRRQKLSNDPRITWIGKFIRSTSLDELPQFWNVFRGDMSLVGPRPFLPEQRDQYNGTDYYLVRPGLTGLWQISERSDSEFADRVRYDDTYVASISFGNDIAILVRTAGVVLRAGGQ